MNNSELKQAAQHLTFSCFHIPPYLPRGKCSAGDGAGASGKWKPWQQQGGAEGLYKVQKGCVVGMVPPAPVLINNALSWWDFALREGCWHPLWPRFLASPPQVCTEISWGRGQVMGKLDKGLLFPVCSQCESLNETTRRELRRTRGCCSPRENHLPVQLLAAGGHRNPKFFGVQNQSRKRCWRKIPTYIEEHCFCFKKSLTHTGGWNYSRRGALPAVPGQPALGGLAWGEGLDQMDPEVPCWISSGRFWEPGSGQRDQSPGVDTQTAVLLPPAAASLCQLFPDAACSPLLPPGHLLASEQSCLNQAAESPPWARCMYTWCHQKAGGYCIS